MDHAERQPAISSPCVGICELAGDHCLGCGRSIIEIGRWASLSEARRREIMDELPARLERMFDPDR